MTTGRVKDLSGSRVILMTFNLTALFVPGTPSPRQEC